MFSLAIRLDELHKLNELLQGLSVIPAVPNERKTHHDVFKKMLMNLHFLLLSGPN